MRHSYEHWVGFIALDELRNEAGDVIRRGLRVAPLLAGFGGFQLEFIGNGVDGLWVLFKEILGGLIGGASDHIQRLILVFVLALFHDVGGDIELDEAERRASLVLRGRTHMHAIMQANIGNGAPLIAF